MMNPNNKRNQSTGQSMDVQPRGSSNGSMLSPSPVPQVAPDQPLQPGTPSKPKNANGPIVAMIIAAVVVLALVVGGVYFFLQSRHAAQPSTADTTGEQATVDESGQVTANEVSTTSKQIDDTLNSMNDSQDFVASDLDDQTIGL